MPGKPLWGSEQYHCTGSATGAADWIGQLLDNYVDVCIEMHPFVCHLYCPTRYLSLLATCPLLNTFSVEHDSEYCVESGGEMIAFLRIPPMYNI